MNSVITGVLLAGGKSSRMATVKALLKLNGRPLVAHVASTLQAVFDRVILVANDAPAYEFLGLETFGDLYQDCGPLGGLQSALVHADGSRHFRLCLRYSVDYRRTCTVYRRVQFKCGCKDSLTRSAAPSPLRPLHTELSADDRRTA